MTPLFIAEGFDIGQIGPLVIGPFGALICSLLFNWLQYKEKGELGKVIENKDSVIEKKNGEILNIAKESVACINNVATLTQSTLAWQAATSQQLNRIEDHK